MFPSVEKQINSKPDFQDTFEEFNNIDFSSILKNGFNLTHNINEKNASRLKDEIEIKSNEFSMDLSLLAGNVVANAQHIPRSLFCPFCADEYMFEFTLKDHLKRFHKDDLLKYVDRDRNISPEKKKMYSCPYCAAIFYHFGLIPKHITNYHGSNLFKQWQLTKGNIEEFNLNKGNESSIIYAVCSPGLSDIFDNLETTSPRKRKNEEHLKENDEHRPRSILKKTPVSGRIITSPSSTSIRRYKNDLTRKSPLARRALRFDLPPSPENENLEIPKETSKSSWRNNFIKNFEKTKPNKNKKKIHSGGSNIFTSTPINILDDDNINDNNKKNWKASLQTRKPSFWASETFQCARCKQTYDNNGDLLMHINAHHKSIKYLFRPKYRCSLCGAKFYRNSYLVRHCQFQHTPRK